MEAKDRIIEAGRKVVATSGTEVQLTATTTPIRTLLIRCKSDNTGSCYVGITGMATADAGLELVKGALAPLELSLTDMSHVYVDADNNGDEVNYIGLA